MSRKILILLLAVALIAGCSAKETEVVTIAEQYGLAYAPLTIAKELGLIEKHLPSEGYELQWEQMMNTASIREAMLADHLDVAFMGIPPFLIGVDNEMNWKIFRGLNRAPLGLTYRTDKISGLDDIDAAHKIAMPQPGSIQHILLTMYLDQVYGSPSALDDFLLTMAHPDGQVALLTDSEVAAHFTSPPYIFEELKEANVELLVDSETAFGGTFTFIVGVLKDGFENEEVIKAVNMGIDEAIAIIEEDPDQAVEILSEVYGMESQQMREYLYWEGMDFSNEVLGVERFVEFMAENEYLKARVTLEEVLYEK